MFFPILAHQISSHLIFSDCVCIIADSLPEDKTQQNIVTASSPPPPPTQILGLLYLAHSLHHILSYHILIIPLTTPMTSRLYHSEMTALALLTIASVKQARSHTHLCSALSSCLTLTSSIPALALALCDQGFMTSLLQILAVSRSHLISSSL